MTSRDEWFEELDAPQIRGDAAESIILAEFSVRGFTVLVPQHDNEAYDFVIEGAGEFYRLQAKTAYQSKNEGTVRFETRSTRVKTQGYEREGYENEVDFFAVYSPTVDEVYVIPIGEAPKNRCQSDMLNRHQGTSLA